MVGARHASPVFGYAAIALQAISHKQKKKGDALALSPVEVCITPAFSSRRRNLSVLQTVEALRPVDYLIPKRLSK